MRAPSASARWARVSTRARGSVLAATGGEGRGAGRAQHTRPGGPPAACCRSSVAAATLPRRRGKLTAGTQPSLHVALLREHTRVSPNVHLGSWLRSHMTCHDRLLPRVPTAQRVCAVALCSEGHVQCRWPQRSGRVWPRSRRGAHAEADASVVAACPDPARPPRPQHCPWHTCVLSAALRDTSRVSYDVN